MLALAACPVNLAEAAAAEREAAARRGRARRVLEGGSRGRRAQAATGRSDSRNSLLWCCCRSWTSGSSCWRCWTGCSCLMGCSSRSTSRDSCHCSIATGSRKMTSWQRSGHASAHMPAHTTRSGTTGLKHGTRELPLPEERSGQRLGRTSEYELVRSARTSWSALRRSQMARRSGAASIAGCTPQRVSSSAY